MTFANPIPWWLLAALASGAVALSWLAYRRFNASLQKRAALMALRLLTLLLLVVLLMRPVARTDVDDTRDVMVPILVDASRSMSIEDAGGRRRIDYARDLVNRELLPALDPRFKVELLAFGDGVSPALADDLSATGRRSDLTGALTAIRERYRGRPIAGIVLLSDGGDTSGGAAQLAARDASAPVYAIGIGSATAGRDREVLSVTAAEAVLDDSRTELAVSAVSHGNGTSPFELRLLENGRPIEVRRAAPADEGSPVHEVFHVAPGRGAPTVYTVEIPAAAGELVPENNSRSVLVQPPSRGRRVLLVEGAPGFEHSFLKRALAADPQIEVDSVVRKGKNEQGTDTFYIQASRSRSDALRNGFPEKIEQLFVYDAIVLANVDASQLTRTQFDAVRTFVGVRGGGLLVLGARSFLTQRLIDSPIEDVIPLDVNDRGGGVVAASATNGLNRVGLTAAGETHPVMQLGTTTDDTRRQWEDAPPLAATAPLGGPRPGATVLASTNGPGGSPRALVAVQRFGEGRAMVFTGEAAWRWRMMRPSTDRSYDRFWRQAIRWLSLPATDPVHVTVPPGGAAGETMTLRVAARDDAFEAQRDAAVGVRVTGPDGRLQQLPVAAGEGQDRATGFTAVFRPDQSGVYRVSAEAKRGVTVLGAGSAALLVGGADQEMADPRLNVQLLQRVAAATGGRLVNEDEVDALAGLLRARIPAAVLSVRRDLWHNGWSFAAIALLLGAEWLLRRRWGLR
jgi:uncharacterized membrane protein